MIEIIKLGAEWCGPCRMMKPVIHNLQKKYNFESSNVRITEIDIDQDPESASKYGVRSVPTIVFLKDSVVSTIKVGLLSEQQIEAFIENMKNS